MIFSPLIFFLMAIFFLVALILLPFLMVGLIGEAFLRLGISPGLVFWLLILTLVGSLVNIPIYRFENRELVGEQVVSYFGMRFRVPRPDQAHATILAVNVGGALIPMALSVYLISQIDFGLSLPILLAVVTVVVNRLVPAGARYGHRGAGSGASPGGGPGRLFLVPRGTPGSLRLYRQHHGDLDRGRSAEPGADPAVGGAGGLHRRRRHL